MKWKRKIKKRNKDIAIIGITIALIIVLQAIARSVKNTWVTI